MHIYTVLGFHIFKPLRLVFRSLVETIFVISSEQSKAEAQHFSKLLLYSAAHVCCLDESIKSNKISIAQNHAELP